MFKLKFHKVCFTMKKTTIGLALAEILQSIFHDKEDNHWVCLCRNVTIRSKQT
jgi:hypothetical protein